ncbi:MAG: methyltransferase domain-containing protein [Thermodesulfobacteriota bacterium]
MTDPAVARRFSIGASRYEAHAHAQRLSAADLLAFTRDALEGRRVESILEPGCGTGLYTRMLLEAFPGASIEGVDISAEMVRLARERIADPRARFATGDAEEIVSGTYDLVTSNATFQWFRTFGRTVRRMASLLSEGGRLTFSYFGPGTFAELDEAMRAEREGSRADRTAAAGFLSREEIEAAMSGAFARWSVEERSYRQDFPDLMGLLKSIRYTGVGGSGSQGGWSPGRLGRVERAYRERFGAIRATYQVFLCGGSERKEEAP